MQTTKLIIFAGFEPKNSADFDDIQQRQQIFDTFSWAFFEKNCQVIVNLQVVKEIINELEELNDPALLGQVRSFFKKMEVIHIPICKTHIHFDYQQANKNISYSVIYAPNASIDFIEYFLKCSVGNSNFLFWQLNLLATRKSFIKDETNFPRQAPNLPVLVNVDTVGNEKDLRDWLKKNRQPRKFKYHTKHKRNTNFENEESPFLYPIGEDNNVEKNLLIDAVGDFTNKEEAFLAIWDEKNKAYLIFPDENTAENTYHGYHLRLSNKYEVTRRFRDKLDLKTFIDKKFKP
jgi:hypothetical protein